MKPKFLHIILLFAIVFCCSSIAEAQTLTKYAKQKQQEVAEKQKIEKQVYEQACQKGTLEAFRDYAKSYPKGKYIDDINKRIEDFETWNTAKRINTIASYNAYLQNSKYKTFKSEAMAAIKDLNAITEWQKIKTSNNLSDVEEYIQKHPNVSIIDEVEKKKHELKGLQYYNRGDLSNAYHEFMAAGDKESLDPSSMYAYEKCQEHQDFLRLRTSTNETDLIGFLAKYPNSKYRDYISNQIAICKAKKLSVFSEEYSYKDALSYAKDNATRYIVDSYYKAQKRRYSESKKQQRRAKRLIDGGIVNLGIEITDIAFNPWAYADTDNDINFNMYYNFGIGLRLGNYKSPLQFEIGAKPGFIRYTLRYDWDDDSDDEDKDSFHLPLYARMKIAFNGDKLSVGDAMWYVDCIGYYNAMKESFLESDYSISVGFGLSWRHWDWRILYYKQDMDSKETYSDYKFFGTSFGYYF